jgi:hypothetical protein
MKMILIHLVSELDKSNPPAIRRAGVARQLSLSLSNVIRDERATGEPLLAPLDRFLS